MLSVRNLVKTYKSKSADTVYALNNVSIDFASKGFVFLLGKSGSGKSTLLNTIGGLDKFDSGEIIIKGRSSKTFSESDFDSYRNTFIGFIFQEYNILENFTVEKNLELALELQGKKVSHEEVNRLLEQVDMLKYAKRKPNELSGGQKQRVAIARALIKNPEIIMADEPTGALDSNTGKQVMDTLKKLSKTKLVIVVSHDREFAEIYGDRIIELKDGNIISDVTKKEIQTTQTQSGIKVIDNEILYIKKGQDVSTADMQKLAYFISKKAKTSDTFISFDENANKKLKEGAKITDDGNREKFVDTTAGDIDRQEYNPKSLKLIKSKLKFSDSFKMGASSLKYKVGKLIFTILLSFFAFTVFGVFDSLACWDRGTSVYEAMQMTGQKALAMQKEEKADYGNNQLSATDEDLKYFRDKYSNYAFVGAVGGSSRYIVPKTISYIYDTDATSDNGHMFKTFNNDYKSIFLGTYANVTSEQIDKLNFTLKGNLPASEYEIAIPKHVAKNMILGSTENSNFPTPLTEDTIIGKYITIQDWNAPFSNNQRFKIVGIVDDKMTFDKYEKMSDEEMQKAGAQNVLCKSWATVSYVHKSIVDKLIENSQDNIYGYVFDSTKEYNHQIYKGNVYTATDCLDEVESGMTALQYTSYNYYQNNNKEYFVQLSAEFGTLYMIYAQNCYYQISSIQNSGSGYVYDGVNKYNYGEDSSGEYVSPTEFAKTYPLGTNGIPTGFTQTTNARQNALNLVLVKQKITYIKSGYINADGTLKTLGADEVILGSRMFDDDIKTIKDKIASGTCIYQIYRSYYYEGSSQQPVETLKVVGLLDDSSYYGSSTKNLKLIVSSETETAIKSCFGSYCLILSNLNGTNTDSKLVRECETFNSTGIKFTLQNEATQTLDMFNSIITQTVKALVYVAIVFAVFAAFLLMNFISTSISHKKREIGVLRALGARGSDVFGIFFNESLIIAFINFVLSAIATFITCGLINQAIIKGLGVTIALASVGLRQILLLLCVSVGSAFLASFIPTMKISRKKPIDAINNR